MEMNKKKDDGRKSTEPLPEDENISTQEQIISDNDNKKKEIVNTKPAVELIKRK